VYQIRGMLTSEQQAQSFPKICRKWHMLGLVWLKWWHF